MSKLAAMMRISAVLGALMGAGHDVKEMAPEKVKRLTKPNPKSHGLYPLKVERRSDGAKVYRCRYVNTRQNPFYIPPKPKTKPKGAKQ